MKIEYLRREPTNRRLLLIFAGWGSDSHLYRKVKELLSYDWDIICVSGYDKDYIPDHYLEGYSTIYLIAWSLGVAAAGILLKDKKITRAFAINGTASPSDNFYGIPEAIFEGTRVNLNERNLNKFRLRMCRDMEEYKKIEGLLPPDPDIEELKSQLSFIREASKENSGTIAWEKVYVGNLDRIIPPDNQLRYWKEKQPDTEIVELDAPHYIDPLSIVEATIPDLSKIERQFQRAHSHYEEHAKAQKIIAGKLARKLKNLLTETGDGELQTLNKVLEIGPGNGMFTNFWRQILHPGKGIFVDICDLPTTFNAAEEEIHIKEDAEEWIMGTEHEFDVILSANTIQWMTDPLEFLKNSMKRLRKGGILAISTFRPGNMYELDILRPSPLAYKSGEQIKKALKDEASLLDIEDDTLTIYFGSARELLIHLKHTGVSGAGKSNLNLSQISKALRRPDGSYTLTYTPLWIVARK